jgi:hypothetical protein
VAANDIFGMRMPDSKIAREITQLIAPISTIVVGPNMLIGGLLKVVVHRPG